MQRALFGLLLALLWAAPAPAAGLLIPKDSGYAPLDMVDHTVTVTIDEQVAVTRVEQTFSNSSDRQLEATYVFPVPKGASVNRFAMWVNGKEVKGEMVEAAKARSIYTDIVRRIQDPGLLEYMGNNLIRLRIFPVPPHGFQKVAVSFTSINHLEAGLVEYTYPLKSDGQASKTLEKCRIDVTIKSQHAIQNVYSPTHAVTVKHKGDQVAHVHFEKKQALLDKDFQLFYTAGRKDIGLTALLHRPDGDVPGHFMFLLSPREELSKNQQLPRDMVFVLDTSGSMAGVKMEQARKALKFCLAQLSPEDHFAVLNFATTVNQFSNGLQKANKEYIARARQWVDNLEATGGTAIDAALKAALELRPSDTTRTFTVVFFTDGEPTVGETRPENIVKAVTDTNTEHTRIFTFGVGDDVNATLLDQLAEKTRAVCTYVRPEEDIEVKVSSLYAKISHPVLSDLKLTAGGGLKLQEVYPSKLPDLFHGGQLVVLGRYTGSGHKAITLTGKVGGQSREFVYEVNFPSHTEDKCFVEGLWARRKVGYLLDEIRRNGEKKELVEEVVKLARKHGIATPYTSYLVVPDTVPQHPPVVNQGASPNLNFGYPADTSSNGSTAGVQGVYLNHGYQTETSATNSTSSAGRIQYAPTFQAPPVAAAMPVPNQSSILGFSFEQPALGLPNSVPQSSASSSTGSAPATTTINYAKQLREALASNQAHTGKLGVDFALQLDQMRNQNQLDGVPARQAAGRTCRQVGEAWIDEGFNAKMKTLTVKSMSKAWFRMLEKQPKLKEVFQLGKRVVWVTPSGVVLVIVPDSGKETMSDAQIDRLFVKK